MEVKTLNDGIVAYRKTNERIGKLMEQKQKLQQFIMQELQASGQDYGGNNEIGKATIVYKQIPTWLNGEPERIGEIRNEINVIKGDIKELNEEQKEIEKTGKDSGEMKSNAVPSHPLITKPKS